MSKPHINPRLAIAALAAVFAVVWAAPAQADPPGDTLPEGFVYEYFGPGTSVADDLVRPDDRADRTGPGYEGTSGAEYAYRGMLPSDYGQPNVIVAVNRPGDGFDWGDALIGGLGGAGMALLLTGSAFLLLNQRNRVRTA